MFPSPKLSFFANGNNSTDVGLTLGETIRFGSSEFTADCLDSLSLPHKEHDSCAFFIRMVHNGSPSLRIALGDSSDEDSATSGTGGALDPLDLEGKTW
jgi:hypothetical protein